MEINIEEMTRTVMSEMEKWKDAEIEELWKIAKQVAKEAREKLKQTSPKGRGSRKGHYKDSWTAEVKRTGANKFYYCVYNKKKPGLTHLLENGHQMRQGGRARAFPHIKKVEEWCIKEFEKRIEERL